MERIGTSTDECLYVGDSLNDLAFAKNANVKGVRAVRHKDASEDDDVICDLSALIT